MLGMVVVVLMEMGYGYMNKIYTYEQIGFSLRLDGYKELNSFWL